MSASARRNSLAVVAAIVLIALGAPVARSAEHFGVISGNVRDVRGIPLVGALVVIQTSFPWAVERSTLTDKSGFFSVPNLIPGSYSIKVSQSRFLPTAKNGIPLFSGANSVLTINLQTAIDVLQRNVNRTATDDITWTLRSSPSTQPILRLMDTKSATANESAVAESPDYSGYVRVFSQSLENSVGNTDAVSSEFAVTVPVAVNSQVTVVGQYSDAEDQPRGFGAKYEFVPGERKRARLAVNVRQGAMFPNGTKTSDLRELNVEYGEELQWSNHLAINYGAEVGRSEAITDQSYIRSRVGASWAPVTRTTIGGLVTTQSPDSGRDSSNMGRSYFERVVYIPPSLERYSHSEAGVSHVLSEATVVSANVFRDRIDTQAVFIDSPHGHRSVVVLDSSRMPSAGIRLHADHQVRHVRLGVGYTYGSGLGLKGGNSGADGANQFVRRRFHMAVALLATEFNPTRTELTAVYRWMSGFSASSLDPYQRFAEYNDPSLSLSIAQNLPLPVLGLIAGKLQAVVDARNLFDQSYGPSRFQFAQSPRLLKGGINLKF